MKRTHLSRGIYPPTYIPQQRKPREKHITACGTICDLTKATTQPLRVTCRLCLKTMREP